MVDIQTAIDELNTGKIEFDYKDDDCCTTEGEIVILLKRLAELEAADVVEVKHGYNKTSMHPVDEFWCSECGFCCADYTETKYDEDGDYTYSCECEFDYCPCCGAKMDGGKSE